MSKINGAPGYRDGWCIHYRAPSFRKGHEITTCEAGIEYDTFQSGPRPCFLDKGHSNPGAQFCAYLTLPTAEEIQAHLDWSAEHFRVFGIVMMAIAPWREKYKGRSHAEIIECPACKGRLHLSIAAYNGHVHGRCESDGCVSWME